MHPFARPALLVFALACRPAAAQRTTLDAFESPDGWKVMTAEGVTLTIHSDVGIRGKCLRLDYDFVTGSGYCIIQKPFNLRLPENYEFSFQLRGQGPANNLEFKLLDPSGDNVWWDNRRALEWPRNWRRFVDKRRTIEFAWGPSNAPLAEAAKIEFAISSSQGGKGSVWLDELMFRPLPAESREPLTPSAKASSHAGPDFAPSMALDREPKTFWRSAPIDDDQTEAFTLDLGRIAEFGGIELDWEAPPRTLSIEASDDGEAWTALLDPLHPATEQTIIPTPNAEARFLRLTMGRHAERRDVGIRELRVQPPGFSASPNALFAAIAAGSPRGLYPRSFLNEQSYWTVIGADSDDAEALINEEGAVELSKRGPILEPFIEINDRLLTWADADHTQSLERGYLPIPSVTSTYRGIPLILTTTAFVDGPPAAATLWINYRLENSLHLGDKPLEGRLHVALRPFQVNPPWQKLNNEGGVARLTAVNPTQAHDLSALEFNDQGFVISLADARAGAASFESGDVAEWLASGRRAVERAVEDSEGRASGEFSIDFSIKAGAHAEFSFLIPFHKLDSERPLPTSLAHHHDACAAGWEERLSRATITVPTQDRWISDTFKSQVAYILINRDGPAIQPGSRSYERSWARDGSMTSAALLACGHADEVRRWIDWFGAHQFESGKVPCVVDSRGPDPVPEHDSHGEYIWAVANYYRTTHDKEFLQAHWPRVQKAVAFIQSLRSQRLTDEYKPEGPKHAMYGLVPESISHEGYSAKPMHSYWDDFFTLLGLKEAAWVARESPGGSNARDAAEYESLANDFRTCLNSSIRAAMAAKQITYIPGCVELGDFDSTSTTIALWPCDELESLPQPALTNTFNRYWDFFKARQSPSAAWDAYTPYELRHVGAFIRLGQPRRAYEALEWFHQHQRPQAWNHWAEVVWHDPLTPKFIGDMPHTWVGSDFLNSVLSMFVYEHKGQVITFAGVPKQWIDSHEEIAFHNIVTPRGKLSGSMQLAADNKVHVRLWSADAWAKTPITVKAPQGSKAQDAQTQNLPAQFSFDYNP